MSASLSIDKPYCRVDFLVERRSRRIEDIVRMPDKERKTMEVDMEKIEKKLVHKLERGDKATLEFGDNGEVYIATTRKPRQAKYKDVTEECTAELVHSQSSGGYYVRISHKGKSVFALGIDEQSKHVVQEKGYRLKKADGATVSFRVTRSREY